LLSYSFCIAACRVLRKVCSPRIFEVGEEGSGKDRRTPSAQGTRASMGEMRREDTAVVDIREVREEAGSDEEESGVDSIGEITREEVTS